MLNANTKELISSSLINKEKYLVLAVEKDDQISLSIYNSDKDRFQHKVTFEEANRWKVYRLYIVILNLLDIKKKKDNELDRAIEYLHYRLAEGWEYTKAILSTLQKYDVYYRDLVDHYIEDTELIG